MRHTASGMPRSGHLRCNIARNLPRTSLTSEPPTRSTRRAVIPGGRSVHATMGALTQTDHLRRSGGRWPDWHKTEEDVLS